MSSKNKIKYNIFKSRKNFNIINWIKNAPEKTYNSFLSYLNKRNISPPNSDYFNKALYFYTLNKEAPKPQEDPVKVEEPIQVEEPVPPEEQIQVEEPAPPEEPTQVEELVHIEEPVQVLDSKKRKRRRTKKVQQEE